MSDPSDYRDFTHTGPGTLAGRYLRTFWQPVYRSEDLAPGYAVPVRIMSEDLALYRDEPSPSSAASSNSSAAPTNAGTTHLLSLRCAHRGAPLNVGDVEGTTIRCGYHGWRYDGGGLCVERPGEDDSTAGTVRLRGYPTREYLGLIFSYLGEGEPPPLRRFPDFEAPGVLAAGAPEYWPCNYFNRIDNAPDGGHVPWTHRESIRRVQAASGQQAPLQRTPNRIAEETDYGLRNGSMVGDRAVFNSHFHMPNINQTHSARRVEGTLDDAANLSVHRLFWRIPVDDEHCVSFVVDWLPLTGADAEAYLARRQHAEESQTAELQEIAEAILASRMRLREVDPNLSIYKLFWIEDYVVQVGQGLIADRSHERLVRSDRGVVLLRKLWERELKALAAGQPLKQWRTPEGLVSAAAGGER